MQIKNNVPLAPCTTFGIGGLADEFVVVQSTDEIIEAVSYAQKHDLQFFLLGSGANILIGDKGVRGLVIKNEARHHVFGHPDQAKRVEGSISNEHIKSDERDSPQGHLLHGSGASTAPGMTIGDSSVFLTADSGAVIADLIAITAEKGLSGLEHFAGIPSTLGGALWQNLHFLSPDRTKTVFIGDIIQESRIMNYELEIKEVTRDYFHFGYDYSILHDSKDIVLSATLKLTKEDPKIIRERIDANLKWRADKHPENAIRSSAGSVFKKIEGHGAGRLIEQVGLKGYRIGGAQISPKHANFIVNTGGATAKDVRDLIFLVQEKVKNELGLYMQPEISFVGEF